MLMYRSCLRCHKLMSVEQYEVKKLTPAGGRVYKSVCRICEPPKNVDLKKKKKAVELQTSSRYWPLAQGKL